MAKSSVENILHFNGVRLRVTGSGNLKLTMHSLSDTVTQDLQNLTMVGSTNIIPTKLCNFRQQRALLEIKTTEMDETFRITKLVMFMSAVASDYPS